MIAILVKPFTKLEQEYKKSMLNLHIITHQINLRLTILLTVKRNNCETPLSEAVSRLIIRKNCSLNLLTYRGNAQQVVFTPIKIAKQSILK